MLILRLEIYPSIVLEVNNEQAPVGWAGEKLPALEFSIGKAKNLFLAILNK